MLLDKQNFDTSLALIENKKLDFVHSNIILFFISSRQNTENPKLDFKLVKRLFKINHIKDRHQTKDCNMIKTLSRGQDIN